jgi:hypothetical protein
MPFDLLSGGRVYPRLKVGRKRKGCSEAGVKAGAKLKTITDKNGRKYTICTTGRVAKKRKTKRPLNDYQLFVKEHAGTGLSFAEIAELWRRGKRAESFAGPMAGRRPAPFRRPQRLNSNADIEFIGDGYRYR